MLAQHFRVEFNRRILLKNVTEIQEKFGRCSLVSQSIRSPRFGASDEHLSCFEMVHHQLQRLIAAELIDVQLVR